ncbi:MAG: hypothetical protein ACYCSB_07005 [bacterium]|jgi:hypothetical protein
MFGFSPIIIILAVIIGVVLLLKKPLKKSTYVDNIISSTNQSSVDDIEFKYDGGVVSRIKLEKAINVFVRIEDEYQKKLKIAIKTGQTEPNHEEIAVKYSEETEAAEKAIKQFGKQIKPNSLKNMQKIFYDIVNNGDDIRRSIAYTVLNSKWDGIGNWRR